MNLTEIFSKYNKFIILNGVCLALLSFIDKALAVGALFVVFLSSITLFFINKSKEKDTIKFLSTLFLIVFLIHAVAVALIFYTNFQPFSEGRGDFNEYHSVARQISERVAVGNFSLKEFSEFPNLVNYYPVIVGYVYIMTIPSMLMGQLLNAWIVALVAIFAYLIVKEIGRSEKEGFIVGLIVGFYPSLFFYGSLLLKDALVILLSTIGLLIMLKILKKFSWLTFLIFYITLIGLTHFRFYISYAIILSFIICWFILSDLKIKKRVVYGIIMIILFGFLPRFAALDGKTQGYMGILALRNFLSPQTITGYRDLAYNPKDKIKQPAPEDKIKQPAPKDKVKQPAPTEDEVLQKVQPFGYYSPIAQDSSISIDTGFDSPVSFFKNSSLSFIYILLGPFPWQLTKSKHLFVLPEIIPWYFLLFFIVKGIVKHIKKDYKVILPLIIFCLVILGLLSLYINNFGIITRIRIPAFLALLCLLPFGFERFKNVKMLFFERHFKT